MSFQVISCPYCNAQVSLPERATTAQRVPCPRCGEAFAYRGDGAIQADAPTPPTNGVPVSVATPPVAATQRWSNGRVARAVLAGMGGMAAIALVFALLTMSTRRARDPKPPDPKVPPAPVVAVAPARLAGLAYLPNDLNLMIGVHVAELQETEDGRLFLDRFRLASTPLGIADIERMTGLDRKDMDHCVAGVIVEKLLLPKVFLVVQTRSPYDEAKLREKLTAGAGEELNGKTIYPFKLQQPALDGQMWCARKDVLVIGLVGTMRKDMGALPREPVADTARPKSALRDIVHDRLSAGTQFWLAGHCDDWKQTVAWLWVTGLGKDQANAGSVLFGNVRTFAMGWQIQDGGTLKTDLDCKDAKAAEEVEKQLVDEKGLLPLVIPRRAGSALPEELGKNLKHVRKDNWVNVQTKVSAETLRQSLRPKE